MSQPDELKTYEVTVVLHVEAKNETHAEDLAKLEMVALLDDDNLSIDGVEALS